MIAFSNTLFSLQVLRANYKNIVPSNKKLSSSSKNAKVPCSTPVYVHPLSQIVLLYFQNECHQWICANNFDRSLTIHRDGTFVLRGGSSEDSPKIWTYYDPMDKKHWLSYKNRVNIQHRFLLQDNLMSAWQGNRRKSLPERIQDSVDSLIESADRDLSGTRKD